MSAVRGLILDYGEVLCTRPAPEAIERMAAVAGLDIEAFTVRYHQERGPYDKGELSPVAYWSKVLSQTDAVGVEVVDTLRQWDVEMWSNIDSAMIDWMAAVRAAGFKTAVLSNMHPDMAIYARRSFEWLQDLDTVVLSCEVGLIKPDAAIYARCVEGLGLRPCEALFIDDRDANVRGASDAGLQAVRFETAERLRGELAGMGLPMPGERPN